MGETDNLEKPNPNGPLLPGFEPGQFYTGECLAITHPESVILHADLAVYLSSKRRYRLFDSGSVSQLMDREETS